MGDRTLDDIVKQALLEHRDLEWIATECWTHDLKSLVPSHMRRGIEIAGAEADVQRAQAKLDALKAKG